MFVHTSAACCLPLGDLSPSGYEVSSFCLQSCLFSTGGVFFYSLWDNLGVSGSPPAPVPLPIPLIALSPRPCLSHTLHRRRLEPAMQPL